MLEESVCFFFSFCRHHFWRTHDFTGAHISKHYVREHLDDLIGAVVVFGAHTDVQ